MKTAQLTLVEVYRREKELRSIPDWRKTPAEREEFRSLLAKIRDARPLPACGSTHCPGYVNCGRGCSNR